VLWFGRVRYRPGGPPEDPALREAWDQGRAQQEGGPSCPTPEQMRRLERFSAPEHAAYWAGAQTRMREPTAPVRLHLEAVLLAIEAALQSAGDTTPAALCAIPVSLAIGKMRRQMEEERARELGRTAETARSRALHGKERSWPSPGMRTFGRGV
jgi:hypothetical protein